MTRAKRAAQSVASALALTWTLMRLLANLELLRKAQVVVVMADWGFGHSVAGPDVARRLFAGRRCVFLLLSEHGRHNPVVGSIWPDIRVLFLPVRFGLRIGRRSYSFPPTGQHWTSDTLLAVLRWLVRGDAGSGPLLLDLIDVYAKIPTPQDSTQRLSHMSVELRWPMCYFRLQQEVPAPPVRLPSRLRQRVEEKLRRLPIRGRASRDSRFCCLYLRQKGQGHPDVTSSSRVGSCLGEYLPAIRLLNGSGYRVFLVGDVELTPEVYRSFGGMLADAGTLGIPKGLFDIYAATEADVFIGEAGGGAWIPGLNGIPSLFVNAFPYRFGLPYSWVYYKTVRDKCRSLVHLRELWSKYAHDWELAGMTLHANSSGEILEAVSHFLEDISSSRERGNSQDQESCWAPDDTWFKHANAKLSPAFLKLFEESKTPVTEHYHTLRS